MTHENILESTLITAEFEKFDSIQFEKIKKKKNDIITYNILEDGRNVTFRDLNSSKDYCESILNSYFYIYKSYFLNNNISAKGLGFIYHGFKVGIWY